MQQDVSSLLDQRWQVVVVVVAVCSICVVSGAGGELDASHFGRFAVFARLGKNLRVGRFVLQSNQVHFVNTNVIFINGFEINLDDFL